MSLVSENIRFLRKKKGLTQMEFADRLAIKRSLVGAYEEGRAVPPPENLNKVAKLFGYSMDELMNVNFKLMEVNIVMNNENPETFKSREDLNPNLFNQFESIPFEKKNEDTATLKSEDFSQSSSLFNSQQTSFKIVCRKDYLAYLNNYKNPDFLVKLSEMSLPNLNKGNYRAFESAEDFLIDDSILISRLVSDLREIKNGQTYVLLVKSQGLIYRRLYNQISIKGTILLSSDFQEIPSLEISSSDVLECWELVSYLSSSLPKPQASLQKIGSLVDELKDELNKIL